jgi:hypothetical protein
MLLNQQHSEASGWKRGILVNLLSMNPFQRLLYVMTIRGGLMVDARFDFYISETTAGVVST